VNSKPHLISSNRFAFQQQDPDVVLQCSGDETFFQRLNLTVLDQIPEISDTVNSFQEEFLNATDRLDANATAADAISAFESLSGNISSTQSNLNDYKRDVAINKEQLKNITNQLEDPFPRFGLPSNFSDVVNQTLADLNTLTNPFGFTYDLTNYFSFNVVRTSRSRPPIPTRNTHLLLLLQYTNLNYTGATPSEKDQINGTQYQLHLQYTGYLQVLETVANVTGVVNNFNTTLDLLLIEVARIESYVQGSFSFYQTSHFKLTSPLDIQNNVTYAVAGLQALASLQAEFIAFVRQLAGEAVAQIYDILRLQNVAKCGWIGTFWNDGVQGHFCSKTNGSIGTAAFLLVFFCLLMFLSTPLIWYSKRALLDDAPKNIADEDL